MVLILALRTDIHFKYIFSISVIEKKSIFLYSEKVKLFLSCFSLNLIKNTKMNIRWQSKKTIVVIYIYIYMNKLFRSVRF